VCAVKNCAIFGEIQAQVKTKAEYKLVLVLIYGEYLLTTKVICGNEDIGPTPAQAAEIECFILGAKLELILNAAYLANIEQSEAFNKPFLEHLEANK
jgi:hypothetical protein